MTVTNKDIEQLVDILKDIPDEMLAIIFVGVEWVDDRAYGLGMDAGIMDTANHMRYALESLWNSKGKDTQLFLRGEIK